MSQLRRFTSASTLTSASLDVTLGRRSTALFAGATVLAAALAATTFNPPPAHATVLLAGDPLPSPTVDISYQGRIDIDGAPASGPIDFRFELFDAPAAGDPVGDAIDRTSVPVFGGVFTTLLDFAPSLFTDARWLQISVIESDGSLSTLLPRQPITPAPEALRTRGITTDATGERIAIGGGAPDPSTDTALTVFGRDEPNSPPPLVLSNGSQHWFMGPNAGGDFVITEDVSNPAITITTDGDIEFQTGSVIAGVNRVTGFPTLSLFGSPTSMANGPDIFIDAQGNVGIGTNTPQNQLHIEHPPLGTGWGVRITNSSVAAFQGAMRMTNLGFLDVTNDAASGNPSFARLNSGGVWTAISDARRKTDIAPLTGGLAGAMQLEPVTYHYRDADGAPTGPQRMGFIAQQVREVYPSLVTEGDDLLTLDYATLSTVAIAALREQQGEIERADRALDSLRSASRERTDQIAQLEAALERMESLLAPRD
ncbi:MAG: tail fiber domain-containing protein [Phycisphaerales bacterium]